MVAIPQMNAAELAHKCQTNKFLMPRTKKKIEKRLNELCKELTSDFASHNHNQAKLEIGVEGQNKIAVIHKDITGAYQLKADIATLNAAIDAFAGRVSGKHSDRLEKMTKQTGDLAVSLDKRIARAGKTLKQVKASMAAKPNAKTLAQVGKSIKRQAALKSERAAMEKPDTPVFTKAFLSGANIGKALKAGHGAVGEKIAEIRLAFPSVKDPEVKASLTLSGPGGVKDRIDFLRDQLKAVEGGNLSAAGKKAVKTTIEADIKELKGIAKHKATPYSAMKVDLREVKQLKILATSPQLANDLNAQQYFMDKADGILARAGKHLDAAEERGGFTEPQLDKMRDMYNAAVDGLDAADKTIKARSDEAVAVLNAQAEAHNGEVKAKVREMSGPIVDGVRGAIDLAYAVRGDHDENTLEDKLNESCLTRFFDSTMSRELKSLNTEAKHYHTDGDGTRVPEEPGTLIANAERAIALIESGLEGAGINADRPVRDDVRAVKKQLTMLKKQVANFKAFTDFEAREAKRMERDLKPALQASADRAEAAEVTEGHVAAMTAKLNEALDFKYHNPKGEEAKALAASAERGGFDGGQVTPGDANLRRVVGDKRSADREMQLRTAHKKAAKRARELPAGAERTAFAEGKAAIEAKQAEWREAFDTARADEGVAASRAHAKEAEALIHEAKLAKMAGIENANPADLRAQTSITGAVKEKAIRDLSDSTNRLLAAVKGDADAWYQLSRGGAKVGGGVEGFRGKLQDQLDQLNGQQPKTLEDAHAHWDSATNLVWTAMSRAYGEDRASWPENIRTEWTASWDKRNATGG